MTVLQSIYEASEWEHRSARFSVPYKGNEANVVRGNAIKV